MPQRAWSRIAFLLLPLAFAACQDSSDPTSPDIRPDGLAVQPPLYSVVDPGAEVNTSILVTPVQCSQTGTVTVTLQGVQPPPEDVPLDLVLVIDESGSISSTQWQQVRQASVSLLEQMDRADGADDNQLNNVRIGLVQFSQSSRTVLNLSGNYATVLQAITQTFQRGGNTNITAGLRDARTMLENHGHPSAARAVILMTDGVATQETNTLVSTATGLKAMPARLFAVGVGNAAASQLSALASPQSFAYLAGFGELEQAFEDLASQALEFAAATDLIFSADVPDGFTLVVGSASATKGEVSTSSSGVSWSIDVLEAETVTLSYQIAHDFDAAPAGGEMAAVTGARLELTTPVSNAPYSEDFEDATVVVTGCDTTAPEISPSLEGTLGGDGWYTSDVTVSWSLLDPESSIAEQDGCEAATLEEDTAGQSFTCSAVSAGGSASETVSVKRDATAPTVAFAGNQGVYDVADDVAIVCSADDALSGLASATCADLAAPAWSLALGTTTLTAEAVDVAGNTATASASFTVTASFDGACTLVQRFVTKAGIANSLCDKLAAAERAAERGNANATRGPLNAAANQIDAQTGKSITPEHAAVLKALLSALL